MSDSQFAYDEPLLLDDAYDAFRAYFKSRDDFLIEYARISDQSLKKRFLRLASVYKHLVKVGSFSVPPESLPRPNFNYYDVTYKFIALISIIEAVFAQDEWLDFHNWLIKTSQDTNVFPIQDQTALDELFDQYNSVYGAIRNTVKFFKTLEIEEQKFLQKKLVRLSNSGGKVSEIESTIKQLADLLYNIRSEFMHNARLIVEFGGIPSLTTNRKSKPFTTSLTLNQLMHVFEIGFLRHFGIHPEHSVLLF